VSAPRSHQQHGRFKLRGLHLWFYFPNVWTIVDASSLLTISVKTKRGKTFPLFTDIDSAREFAERAFPPKEKQPLQVPNASAIRNLLNRAIANGCEYVAVDPLERHGRGAGSIGEVLESFPQDE
jgi:hypothetical protein